MIRQASVVVLLLVTGCGIDPGKNPEPVDVSGSVTLKGKPMNDITLNFQAISAGAQTEVIVKNGKYTAKILPGTYTYYLSEGRRPNSLSGIPEIFRAGAMDRRVIIGNNPTVDFSF